MNSNTMVYVPFNNSTGTNMQQPHRAPLWRRLATVRWFLIGAVIAVIVYGAGMIYGWQYLGQLLPAL